MPHEGRNSRGGLKLKSTVSKGLENHVQTNYTNPRGGRSLLAGLRNQQSHPARPARPIWNNPSPPQRPSRNPLGAFPARLLPPPGGEHPAIVGPGSYTMQPQPGRIPMDHHRRDGPWRRTDLVAGQKWMPYWRQWADILLLRLPGLAGIIQTHLRQPLLVSGMHAGLRRNAPRAHSNLD